MKKNGLSIKVVIKPAIPLVFKPIYFVITKLKWVKPIIIVPLDGGVCSQMHQYLIGQLLKSKGNRVEYDLLFYKKHGFDCDFKQVRNFDLIKAFPYLEFKEVSSLTSFLYRCSYFYKGQYPESFSLDWMNVTAPRYMGGYYANPDYLYSQLFVNTFFINPLVLDEANLKIFNSMRTNSVAIHVRRGDLSGYNEVYGYPVTEEYFHQAIEYINTIVKSPTFYIFTDDNDYVEKELLPKLPSITSVLVGNKADKGYMDIILISRCTHVITSKGTLGKYGSLFNMTKEKRIVASKDDNQLFCFDGYKENLVII